MSFESKWYQVAKQLIATQDHKDSKLSHRYAVLPKGMGTVTCDGEHPNWYVLEGPLIRTVDGRKGVLRPNRFIIYKQGKDELKLSRKRRHLLRKRRRTVEKYLRKEAAIKKK